MAAMTGQSEPDGLSQHNRHVVETSLRGIGEPATTHPEMGAVAWMLGCGMVAAALVCASIVCGPALWALAGGVA